MKVLAPQAYRHEIETAVAAGERARSLYAGPGGRAVRVLLQDEHGRCRLVATEVAGDLGAPSIADLAPAMVWDEREAHDLAGITFSGHDPLRPLVHHAARLEDWTVPVRGDDAYQVAVGPIHAGIIESGHFRFAVVGDRILHVDARLFYKHRGLERAAEGRGVAEAIAVVSRSCAACSVTNAVAYAEAAEQILGLQASPGIARARVALLELERVWNHLNDLAAVCAGVGLAAGTNHFLALVERARRLNAALVGHRFLAHSIAVGASTVTLDVEVAAAELAELRHAADTGWHALVFNASFQDRLDGVGIVDAVAAERLGVAGPPGRAAGVETDARLFSTYPAYEGFRTVHPDRPSGDVRARVEQRVVELGQSFELLARLLDAGPVEPAVALDVDPAPDGIGIGVVEGPRGATSCIVEAGHGTVERVRLRTASYANWPAVTAAAAGNLLPDFPLINKSFELCYACVDR